MQVGTGNIVGNPLFETFDAAVRGMALGQVAELEAEGPEWNPELLFEVPVEHPEIARLNGRYKATGGVFVGRVVELSNGGQACILEVGEKVVKMDANNMLAGQTMLMELEVMAIKPKARRSG